MNPSDPGRGTLVYIHENLDYSLTTNNSSFCENLFLKIKIGRNIINFGVLYKSQNSTKENNHQLKNLIANLNKTQSNDSTKKNRLVWRFRRYSCMVSII